MDRQCLPGHEEAVLIIVKGRVQGVGFRPFLYHLAEERGIKGTVRNSREGLQIIAEGSSAELDHFIRNIQHLSPVLAKVEELRVTKISAIGYASFSIIESDSTGPSSLSIAPDIAVCEECLKEWRDPRSRFYRYPFINCTQCGPRYSIIRKLPYDRAATSMSSFSMCEDCRNDYSDIRNRRFHAQPIACRKCGPKLNLLDRSGKTVACMEEAVLLAKRLLKKGCILAVKGVGGYHLACDALSSEAVRHIRLRKKRPRRPLAVMASSVDICETISVLSTAEKKLLTSPQRPIVVAQLKHQALLPAEIAPNMKTIGLMLPYTPLHYLLLEDDDLPCLVMTSANSSGDPIVYRDEEALCLLKQSADYILTHDRKIVNPIEDTVVQWKEGAIDFLRRGRGYVPDPIDTNYPMNSIVALGGQQKSVVAIGRGRQVFLGPPNGDLGNLEMELHGQEQYQQFSQLLGVSSHTAAVDLHPGYTTLSLVSDSGVAIKYVQHHHAHHVSCMVEHGITERCYGLILDGTGFGMDGCIWGFELLYGNAAAYDRLGHLRYTPLPGGDASVKQPWRTAAAMVMTLLQQSGERWLRNRYPNKEYEIGLIRTLMEKQVNAPMAGTCGRLFDAVSSLLGLCDESTYEGEAAIVLSELASFHDGEPVSTYPYAIVTNGDLLEIDFSLMFRRMLQHIDQGVSHEHIALKFHETVAEAAVNLLLQAHEENTERRKEVVLSGGSFHNRLLSKRIGYKLAEAGFTVYVHKQIPCDDGGIALGQLAIVSQKASWDRIKE
ncbi:carbamoyltransferase HypF [Paenibacillus sp. UNC451MF]|uniref:carbamoyltransferase HypF n=1 Tax=Paenibacillus sp. UNC451MF TaxID=1449063 RepID=UPI000491E678|nr:carbamoyltransferase HypF [Paenibacillus sp. UNC451MF]